MSRVKGGATSHTRHKKVLKAAKGYYGRRKSCFRTAVQAVEKAGQYAYRDRRNKKRDIRKLWIQRINAGTRVHDMNYSSFINGLKQANVEIDRKVLAHLAMNEPQAFGTLVETSKKALNAGN